MVYHSEPNHFFHDWKNYSRKGSYNPVPQFKFPTQSIPTSPPTTVTPLETTIAPETTTMEHLTKIFNDIFTPFTTANKGIVTESNIVTSTTQNSIINNTFTDIIGLSPNNTLTESTTSNSSVIAGIMENTTGSSIRDLMQNGSIPIDTAQNGTDLMDTTMGNNGTFLTEIANSTAENVASILTTTTEKAITFATETVHKISSNTEANKHDHGHVPHYHYAMGSHRLLYVILLVIIAILILIGVILLLIYIRYRKNSFRVLQNYYEISPMKERTPSDLEPQGQKESPPEMYMRYQC